MPASTASPVSPVLAWDKNPVQTKTPKKKSNPLIVVAVLAIVLLGASGVWRATHQKPTGQFIKVVTALRDMPAGTRIGFMKVKFLDVPKALVTKNMVLALDDIDNRTLQNFIPAGEPILFTDMMPGHGGLSSCLENDERALTLTLSDEAMVDHAILPGDRVDLLAVTNKEGKQYTKTLCQGAKVLMAAPKDQTISRGIGNAANNKISLSLTPQMAEYVTEAAETGKIRLTLRNRLGRSEQHLLGVGPKDLLPAKANDLDAVATPKLSVQSELLPSPPAMPPLPEMKPMPAASAPETPVQWLVEVFSGSKRDTYGVSNK